MAVKKAHNNSNIIPIRDLIFHCLSKWYWFVITLAIAMGMAVYKILSTPPQYVRYAEILIKEDTQSGGSGTGSTFKELSSSKSSAQASHEMIAFQSTDNMKEAIRRLNLGIIFKGEGRFYDGIIYSGRPLEIKTPELSETDHATFTAIILPDSTIKLNNFTLNEENITHGEIIAPLGSTVDTPLGAISLQPTTFYENYYNQTLYIEKHNYDLLANELCSNLKARLASDETSVISLSINDISTIRATDILNTLIEIYNQQWVLQNNAIVVKTVEFIKGRAEEIKRELEAIDNNIAIFRGDKRLSMDAIGSLAIEAEETKENEELISLNNQLELINFIKSYMGQSNSREIIPANTGIAASSVEQLINKYNTKLLERNRLVANSSESNPVIVDYDKDLDAMFAGIQSAIASHTKELEKQISRASKEEQSAKSRITATTHSEKELQTLLRQQKVKNALYLFLLQKLEETELSKELTASNNRVLIHPTGSNIPVEPLKKPIIMLALIIGFLLPLVVIFVREITNNKIRGRKDLENLNIPFVGEIPLNNEGKKKKIANKNTHSIVIKNGSRNVINEAFRVMRTNFEFMIDKEKASNVIILTSFNPGSGKTFITMNLAATLAIKGAPTLVIDGDLRHASASEYVEPRGNSLADYLSGGTHDIDSIITTNTGCDNLHVMAVGTPPPNPTELLNGKHFEELIEQMRKRYKYILIDCPPIDIVADTQIIERYTDKTLFIVRAGLLHREMLDELQDIYDTKRLKGVSIVLNGTHSGGSRYSYKYGYSYSYGYGYGYGYHYHQKDSKRKKRK